MGNKKKKKDPAKELAKKQRKAAKQERLGNQQYCVRVLATSLHVWLGAQALVVGRFIRSMSSQLDDSKWCENLSPGSLFVSGQKNEVLRQLPVKHT